MKLSSTSQEANEHVHYRRAVAAGGTCFFTVNLAERPSLVRHIDPIEPSAKKRRPKNLPLLTVPRQVAWDIFTLRRELKRVP